MKTFEPFSIKNARVFLFLTLIHLVGGIYVFIYSDYGMGGMLKLAPDAVLIDTIQKPTPQKYNQVLQSMGEGGRAFYLKNIHRIDTIFPFIYTMPMASYAYLILSGLGLYKKKALIISFFFFIPAFFDLGENYYLYRIVSNYPKENLESMLWAIKFSNLKGITRDLLFYTLIVVKILQIGFGFVTKNR